MRKTLVLLSALLLVTGITGCSANSSSAKLAKIISNTQKQMGTLGVLVTDTLPDGTTINEVHKPDSTFFVNEAVFNTDGTLKQISRKNPGDVLSVNSAFAIATATTGQTFDFATTTFKILNIDYTNDKNEYKVNLKVKDQTGSMGTLNTTLTFETADDLVQSVNIDSNLYNRDNPEEVCLYYPTGCSLSSTLDYDTTNIDNQMNTAFEDYQNTQLHDPLTVANFKDIMTQINQTYSQYPSWTVTNSDESSGVVFDADSNKGVRWDSYGDPATVFDSSANQELTNGPDMGFTSSIFFDTTDGGSTFFFSKVVATSSGTTNSYDVIGTDGSVMGNFTFTNGLLTGFTDSLAVKTQYQVSPKADLVLLKKKSS
jgi:hypothetical protein